MKRVLGYLRRADEKYSMIDGGDTLVVGLSGGKDSMLLLDALCLYRRFSRKDFRIEAYTVDLGFAGFDIGTISDYCASLGVAHTVIETKISTIVFELRDERSPCALCSKLRKGALFTRMKENGYEKCVFAHHREDCIESFLLSMLYEGRLRTFTPVTRLSRTGVTLIRPFILLPEKEIKAAVKRRGVPSVENPCPVSGETKRQEMKRLLAHISASNPKARDRIMTALENTKGYSLWDKP